MHPEQVLGACAGSWEAASNPPLLWTCSYSEDRREMCKPPQLATAKSGAGACRWVGRWALHPEQCRLVHYVQQRVAAAWQGSRSCYLTRFSTEYTEM